MLRRLHATPVMELIANAERRKSERDIADRPQKDSPLQRTVAAVKAFFEEINLGEVPFLAPALNLDGADNGHSDDTRVLLIGDAVSGESGMSWLGDSLHIVRARDTDKSDHSLFTVDVKPKKAGANHSRLRVWLKWANGASSVILSAARPCHTFPESCPSDWHDLRVSVEPV